MSITNSQTDAKLTMLLPNFAAVWLGAFKGTSKACASALSLAWRSASIAAFISLVRRSFWNKWATLVGSSCLDLVMLKKSKYCIAKMRAVFPPYSRKEPSQILETTAKTI